jgi:hypothetical protein
VQNDSGHKLSDHYLDRVREDDVHLTGFEQVSGQHKAKSDLTEPHEDNLVLENCPLRSVSVFFLFIEGTL